MTKATLINKQTGLRIKGEIEYRSDLDIEFKIEGTSAANSFDPTEWEVELNRPELPTKTGSVIQITRWAGRPVNALLVYRAMLTHGGWRIACDNDLAYKAERLNGMPAPDFQWEELL